VRREEHSPFTQGVGGAGPLLVVISGPSGAGKDTVLARVRDRGLPFHFTVTATTRPRREGDAADDPFLSCLSEAEFDRLLAEDGLMEHAQVYGFRYGVPKPPVKEALERGQDVLVRVDVQGAASIKALAPGAVLIFLVPPSLEEMEARLRARALDDEATLRRRLERASGEMEQIARFDYVVVNEDGRVDDAVKRVLAIMTAEHCRVGRRPVAL